MIKEQNQLILKEKNPSALWECQRQACLDQHQDLVSWVGALLSELIADQLYSPTLPIRP